MRTPQQTYADQRAFQAQHMTDFGLMFVLVREVAMIVLGGLAMLAGAALFLGIFLAPLWMVA